ncbi:MAG: alpha/beta hydrolase [Firmicutes bacterium]|nr:alpha/beta hydrolase [Bacillota bacterium]MCL1953467.1 alpha/beta hydrolase [Bacillota bacterium]
MMDLDSNNSTKNISAPHYRITQGVGVPIVLLHGWGGSMMSWASLEQRLIDVGHTVVVVDFAGFGMTPEPPINWGIYEYAQSIKVLLDELGCDKYNLIGHSFGGRVCLILGNDKRINNIILSNAAGIKPRRGIKYYAKIWSYKFKKKLEISTSKAGSADYRALSTTMQAVFVKIVNQHLQSHLNSIKANTLIVWGDKDKTTPLYMAKKLNKGIKGSGLIVLKNAGHYSYMEHGDKFFAIVESFFGD